MYNNKKFCPLLSTAETKVYCSDKCAFFSKETQLGRCAILDISETLSQLSMDLSTHEFISSDDENS